MNSPLSLFKLFACYNQNHTAKAANCKDNCTDQNLHTSPH